MKLDLKKHKLLTLLSDKTIRAESGQLLEGESLGVSFEDLTKEMRCDILKLNLIAAELYLNKEIGYFDNEIKGLFCDKNGLISFSNNKYKERYWKSFWDKMLTANKLLIPILSLIVAILAISLSMSDKEYKTDLHKIIQSQERILLLEKTIEFQSKEISNLYSILKSDSLQGDLRFNK
jgi:hypothetical protein